MNPYPLILQPTYKDYLWGGNKIIKTFGRDEPPGVYAESWEVSTRPEGMSSVANGEWAGRTLQELVEEHGTALLGTDVGDAFPLLIKLIDSRDRLSVQVHPDDESAGTYGGEAKTEMWYILQADPDAAVFAGLRPGTTPERFEEAVEADTFEDVLVRLPVHEGGAVFMKGGTVHAIDAGCLILEVQQNSNTTYRIYDWGRVGPDGSPRDLHLREALQVTDWDPNLDAMITPRRLGFLGRNELWEIHTCPYFRMERLLLTEEWHTACDHRSFHVLFPSAGRVVVKVEEHEVELSAGTTCFIPAAASGYSIAPIGESTVLRITVP